MSRVLLTGMTGFVGSCLAKQIQNHSEWQLVALHRLESSQPSRDIESESSKRIQHVFHDFTEPLDDLVLEELGTIDFIVHCGAEVHALRSVENPTPFVRANVLGTFHMLEAARRLNPSRFLYVSSAEVLGGSPARIYLTERENPRPSNPYAASKYGGEALVYSYHRCYNLPTITVRTMNLFGEEQGGGKFIPVTTAKLLNGEEIAIHVNGSGEPGVRQWIHGDVFAEALMVLLDRGRCGETYHVAGDERNNLAVAERIASVLGVKLRWRNELISKTHEWRYGIDDQKMRKLGWMPHGTFEDLLARTVLWTKEHPEWLV